MAKSKLNANKASGPQTKTSKIDAASIVEDEYGNYRIRAGRLSGNFVARAFPKVLNENKGLMAEATGASEEEAIAALKILLDERGAQRVAARRWDQHSEISVPSAEEFTEALRQADLTEAQMAMLKTQAFAGGEGLTMSKLTHAAGYQSELTASRVYARAGALIAEYLGVDLTADETKDKNDAARVFGYLDNGETDAPALMVMHEEMRTAVIAAA